MTMAEERKVIDALREIAERFHEGSADEVALRYAADWIEKLEEKANRLQRQVLYEGVMPEIARAARECGYAIFINGSLQRDCDIVAVPWSKTCFTEEELLKRIVFAATLRFGFAEVTVGPTHRPHGLTAYVILLTTGKYLDLKIVPAKGFPAGGNPIEMAHPVQLVPKCNCQCYSCGATINEYTWVTTLICQKCSKDAAGKTLIAADVTTDAVGNLEDKLAATEDEYAAICQQLAEAERSLVRVRSSAESEPQSDLRMAVIAGTVDCYFKHKKAAEAGGDRG
jgi:hypothetical protein